MNKITQQKLTNIGISLISSILGISIFLLILAYLQFIPLGNNLELLLTLAIANTVNLVIFISLVINNNNQTFSQESELKQPKQTEQILKQYKEKLNLALDSASAGIWEWDLATNACFWSEQIYHLLGYEVNSCESNYQNWFRVIHPDDQDRIETELKAIIETKNNLKTFNYDKYVWDFLLIPEEIEPVKAACRQLTRENIPKYYENYWQTKSGKRRLISWSNTTIFDDNDRLKNTISIGIDITEQKQAEKIRLQLETQQEINQLQRRFFSMVSHEFRTPLTTILMSSQILENTNTEWLNTKVKRNLERIEISVKRSLNLLEDILTINRAEAGKITLNPEPLDLVNFCQKLAKEISPDSRIINLKFTDLESQEIYLDQKILHSILNNLLINAIKYSPEEKEIIFQISCQENTVTFSVEDQGIGIPEADIPRLFEPLHRATNVNLIPGTGLGLTIVKKLVDLQGGQITVESQENIGTTFTVTLPLTSP